MPVFDIAVEFVLPRQVQITAPDEATARFMLANVTNDQAAHLLGKSYAQVEDADVRILSVVEAAP